MINSMPVFECRLKEDRAGMRRGTTIHVQSAFSNATSSEIADECERRFGKKTRDASFTGYWEIRKL